MRKVHHLSRSISNPYLYYVAFHYYTVWHLDPFGAKDIQNKIDDSFLKITHKWYILEILDHFRYVWPQMSTFTTPCTTTISPCWASLQAERITTFPVSKLESSIRKVVNLLVKANQHTMLCPKRLSSGSSCRWVTLELPNGSWKWSSNQNF